LQFWLLSVLTVVQELDPTFSSTREFKFLMVWLHRSILLSIFCETVFSSRFCISWRMIFLLAIWIFPEGMTMLEQLTLWWCFM
jgi:hypothetical protein